MRAITLLVGILISIAGSLDARTTQAPKPLTVVDVEHGLTSSVPNARMTALVKKYGVDFELTRGLEAKLRNSGANERLIAEIRRSRVRVEVRSAARTPHAVERARVSANSP